MTREEQLLFCKKCLNRQMDLQQGLVCQLTGEKANFQTECPDFDFDETAKPRPLDNEDNVSTEELQQQLSPELMAKLRKEQRLFLGLSSGLIVGLIGAILWGVITVVTKFQIGYMAIAIGAGVGLTIRTTGNGIDPIFKFSGAVISLFSVLLGNFFSLIGFIAIEEGLGYFETLPLFDYTYLSDIMIATFSPIDIVFYAIALGEGYYFSSRLITEKKLMELKQQAS